MYEYRPVEGSLLQNVAPTYMVGAAKEIQKGDESSVDPVTAIKYEYISPREGREETIHDYVTEVAPHIDSKMNPAYSSIVLQTD